MTKNTDFSKSFFQISTFLSIIVPDELLDDLPNSLSISRPDAMIYCCARWLSIDLPLFRFNPGTKYLER